jgi:hypothetical protein
MLHCPDDDDDDHDVDDDEDHDGVRHSGGSAAVDPTYERPEVVAPALRAAQLYWVRGPMGGVVRRRVMFSAATTGSLCRPRDRHLGMCESTSERLRPTPCGTSWRRRASHFAFELTR